MGRIRALSGGGGGESGLWGCIISPPGCMMTSGP